MASDAICSLDREAEDTGKRVVILTVSGIPEAGFFPVLYFLQDHDFGQGTFLLPIEDRKPFAIFAGEIATGTEQKVAEALWGFFRLHPEFFGKEAHSYFYDLILYPWGIRDTSDLRGAGWVRFDTKIATAHGIKITQEMKYAASLTSLAL